MNNKTVLGTTGILALIAGVVSIVQLQYMLSSAHSNPLWWMAFPLAALCFTRAAKPKQTGS